MQADLRPCTLTRGGKGEKAEKSARASAVRYMCVCVCLRARGGRYWQRRDERSHATVTTVGTPKPVLLSPLTPLRRLTRARTRDFSPTADEATLAAGALLAVQRQTRVTVYLTCLGGGAFGNRTLWIKSAIDNAVKVSRSRGWAHPPVPVM